MRVLLPAPLQASSMKYFCVNTFFWYISSVSVWVTTFMHDGALPHVATPVKQLLSAHFRENRIISRHFLTTWLPRYSYLNSCDFWIWGYLKNVVYSRRVKNLADLKASITSHIYCISIYTPRFVVEHAVLRFTLVAEQSGGHIQHLMP